MKMILFINDITLSFIEDSCIATNAIISRIINSRIIMVVSHQCLHDWAVPVIEHPLLIFVLWYQMTKALAPKDTDVTPKIITLLNLEFILIRVQDDFETTH